MEDGETLSVCHDPYRSVKEEHTFLEFHPHSPHACADGLQARKEGKSCDSPISLAGQDWEMSEFAADASVSHYS